MTPQERLNLIAEIREELISARMRLSHIIVRTNASDGGDMGTLNVTDAYMDARLDIEGVLQMMDCCEEAEKELISTL